MRRAEKQKGWCAALVAEARHSALPLALCLTSSVSAQDIAQPRPLPFAIGERFTYAARAESMGISGKGQMWVEGPVDVRGVSTWLLRFEVKAGFGQIGGSERSSSWIDATRMTALRYVKRERRVLAGHEEAVELFPDESRWVGKDGTSGTIATSLPLDELSFIYFIRTLPLAVDSVYSMDRHFDARRNPTVIRVLGREIVETRAGTFRTLKVEMTVKDPHNYDKVGVIRLLLSDDARRIPVRIESEMSKAGTVTLTLESHNCPAPSTAAVGGGGD